MASRRAARSKSDRHARAFQSGGRPRHGRSEIGAPASTPTYELHAVRDHGRASATQCSRLTTPICSLRTSGWCWRENLSLSPIAVTSACFRHESARPRTAPSWVSKTPRPCVYLHAWPLLGSDEASLVCGLLEPLDRMPPLPSLLCEPHCSSPAMAFKEKA